MDFLKGIGDFFNGWLGGKKRKRIQDEMNAVGEQAYQQVKEEASMRPQPQTQAVQSTSVSPQIQADRQSQPQTKLTNLSEDSQQATQSANASLNRFNANRQARFNQMRRMGAGFGEATGRLQAEQDAINQQVRAREAEEREKHEREVKQPLREQIEQSRQAINNSTNISQYQKDAFNQRADELKKKLNYVSDLNNVEYKDWWTPDYERFSKLNQRLNEAHSLGKRVFDQTGDANKARQAINQQLEASDTMTRLEDQEKSYRDTAKAIALPTQLPRDIIKNVGRYGTKLATSGIEALGNMTNNQAVANAARQGQQAIDEAVFNKFDTEYDNQILKGLTSGVTDLGMDLVTGKAVVGALGKAGALGKITQGADKANKFLSQQGKLSGLVGKGIQAGLGSSEAIASTATSLLRHYPQNYNEIYTDARAQGMNHHQANVLAHSNAVINAGIEKMNLDMSGWFKAPATTPNRGFQAIKRALGEGAEEWTQTMATYAIKSIYSDINWNKALTEANESGLMGVAVGGIADQISTRLPKVLHKLDQEIDHKVDPTAQPITNALIKTEIKQQISQAVQPDSQVLAEAMKLNDEAVKYKLASDEHGQYVEGELQDGFKTRDIKKLQKRAKSFNNNLYEFNRPIAQLDGDDVGVLKESGGKWGYYNPEMKNDIQTTIDKLQMTPLQGEMIKTAKWNTDKDGNPILSANRNKKDHPDVEYWQYGETRYQAPSGKQYTGIVNLGLDQNYQPVYYTVDKIKEFTLPAEQVKNYGVNSNDFNIPQPDQNVNDDIKYKIGDDVLADRNRLLKEARTFDSKQDFIDKNLLMYHGTPFEFDDFENKTTFFSPDKEFAKSYAINRSTKADGKRVAWDGPNVITAGYGGNNLFDYKNNNHVSSILDQIPDNVLVADPKILGKQISKTELIERIKIGDWQVLEAPEVTEAIKNAGFDGHIATESGSDTVAIYEPNKLYEDENFNKIDAKEKELARIYDEAHQNVNQDVKTKIADISNQLKSSIDELKARHFKLTGDNDITFNAFAEAIQDIGNIEGYYDPKTNTVHIGELAEYVLNHEVVHKTLSKYAEAQPEMKTELFKNIADRYGLENIIAEYNQKGYGEQAVNGHTLDASQPKDVRLAVEEKLADEFNTYLDQYQKGRANYYANKVGLTPTIRAWFDRIIEGLKEFFGKADQIKQFYAQLETGKFSTHGNIGVLEKAVSRLEDSVAYKRSPDAAKRALAGFKMVQNGWRKQATLTQLTAETAERYRQVTGSSVKDDAKLILTSDTVNHLRNSGHLTGQGIYGRNDTNPLTDADMANIHEVFNNPDQIKVVGDGRLGKRLSVTKMITKNHQLGVDLISDGSDFYVVTYFNKSRSPQQVQASSSEGVTEPNPLRPRPERSSEAYGSSISQADENVKFKLSESAQEVSDFYYNDHQSPAEMRQELINKLWEANKQGQGVDHIFHEAENALDDTYMVRASNNSPFYSAYFEANGKKPTKAGITAIVDEILGVENDKQRPTVTSEMWQALAGEYGDLGGISHAYKRLLNKKAMRPQTAKESIRKAIALRQAEQNFVDLANGNKSTDDINAINSSDDATHRKIMIQALRPEHQALETAPYQVLELYNALQKDLKRAGQNIAISDQNLNKEDVGKFKQQYNHILNEMNRLVDGEASRQRLLKSTQQIQNKLIEWQDSYQENNNTAFPTLDGAISTNFLNQTAPSFNTVRDQISDWTGLDKKQSTHYLSNMLERTGYEVADGTIVSIKGAGLQMSDDELDLLKRANKSKRLNDKKRREIYSDRLIQALADKASDDGRTYQIIYTTNKDTNATGILSQLGEDGDYEPTTYSPEDHYIYKGAVYQRNSNRFLGHLIQITPSSEKDGGIGQIKVWDGNTYTTSNIDFSKLKGGYDRRYNTALNLENVADGDEKLLAALNTTLVDPVRQGEAKLKEEAIKVADNLTQYEKAIKKLVGRRRAKEAMFDLVLFIEPPQTDNDGKKIDRVQYLSNAEVTLQNKYGQKMFEKMVEAKKYIRELYDDMLERENTQRLKYGMPLIKKRQDYLSHYVELSANADPIHDNLGGNLMRDIFGKQQRGSIPTVMQGLTHDTKVKKKFAGYEKHRLTDNNKPLNAFDAVRTYARTSLYNIHMMDAIAGIRGFETAIKAYESINSLKPNHQAKLLFGDTPSNYDNTQLSSFVKFVQEHANIVAGKSSSADREALASDDGVKALKRWRKLQQITGLSKIAGNVGSFVMQPVNQGAVVAELVGDKKGLRSYLSSWISLLADNSASATARKKLFNSDVEAVWKKSNFLRARYADASGLDVINSKAERAIKGIGKATEFLGVLEQISTTQGWTAYYKQARAQGKTEAQAILIADHKANKTLTGRGIGDGAHIYSDTKEAAIRQFTRETNDIWRLMTNNKKNGGWNARQMMVFLAATYGLNTLMKMRGSKATPDPLEAIINELKEINDGKDKITAGIDMIRGVTGEVANMHPSAQILLAMMPDNARKMVFGEDSEIGRYGMKPAITSVIGDTFNTADHIIGGRLNKTGQSAVGMMPFGAQIKKTWEGVEALNQGYTTNQYGRPKQAVERDFGNVIRGTLFGKTGLSGSNDASQVRNLQKEYDLKKQLKDYGVNINNINEWKPTGDNDKDKKAQSAIFRYKMGDDLKIYQLSETKRKQAVVNGQLTKKQLETIDQKARKIKQQLGMEVEELDKYQDTFNKVKLERDYLDKSGYDNDEDKQSIGRKVALAEFKLKLSKNPADRPILEAYDRMEAAGFKRFNKNDLRRFAQHQDNPQDFWNKLLDLDKQQYQITGKYKLHNQDGKPDTIEQTTRGRGRRKSGKINFNSGVDFSAINTKARSIGQSINSPARGTVSYQISNNAFTYQPMPIRRSSLKLPKYKR